MEINLITLKWHPGEGKKHRGAGWSFRIHWTRDDDCLGIGFMDRQWLSNGNVYGTPEGALLAAINYQPQTIIPVL